MIWRLWFLGIVLSAASPGLGATHYVNNRSGDDANDGLSPAKALATIARAIQGAKTSDTISLAKTGTAYREPIPLVRLGGTPAQPLVIEGNGATISGLRQLPPERWTKAGEVYEIAGPKPYGFPYLVVDGQRVPPAAEPDKLPPGGWSWTADAKDRRNGILRFRPAAGRTLADYKLEATLEVSGLCVSSASYIVVRNLISEGHSNDGFNIHGDCRGIYCENIEARLNGDDGFSIHEAIEAVVRNGHFHHNGSGIEDVNLSRSLYSGIRVHDNTRLGVLFIGAFHSAVDAVGHNEHSMLQDPKLSEAHTLGPESPHQIGKETIGPTAHYCETPPVEPGVPNTRSEVIKP